MAHAESVSLETAAEARVCGRYHEAIQIFANQHAEASTEPGLILEYASLLAAQGLQYDRAIFLRGVLERIKMQESNESTPRTFVPLLELLLADAEYWAFGKWSRAVKAMRKAQAWLRTADVNSQTDDEVPPRFSVIHFLY